MNYGSVDGDFTLYDGLVIGNGNLFKPTLSVNGLRLEVVSSSVARPALFVPGFGGTFAADTSEPGLDEWYTTRGIEPEKLALEPLKNSYSDLLQSLENVGYVEGATLFAANWDWRVPVAAEDSTPDGFLEDVTAASIQDATYETGVDYLGYWLDQATNAWNALHGVLPTSVDLIAHSTGGLVTRSYIQSQAYGQGALPEVNHLVQVGVPNQGVSTTWNLLEDDWSLKPGSRLAGSIVNQAFTRLKNGLVAKWSDDEVCERI